jgi:hypothetical protein
MISFLEDFQKTVAALPTYASEPPRIVIHRKYYNMMVHAAYKASKAVRKAKARKKRINAKCGR